jgi:hypothetical protein
MTKRALIGLTILVAIISVGCSKQVPPGHIGMVMEPEGLVEEVLSMGRHTCWGRDRLVLVEEAELPTGENLSVLCADDLNFKFDLKLRVRLLAEDAPALKAVLSRMGSRIRWGFDQDEKVGILQTQSIYDTYVKDPAKSISRGIVSKYETTQIREARESIEKAIQEKLIAAIQGAPIQLTMLATSNFDYPDVITTAVEKKRKREIEIGEEKAKQAMELLKVENRLKIAQKEKITRAAEAEAEAVYFEVLGKKVGIENYIKIRNIEAHKVLYQKVGVGDKVIVTGGNGNGVGIMPLLNLASSRVGG